MRILNPGCGECVDRITILQLKIDAAQAKNLSSDHFEDEKYKLELYVSQAFPRAFDAQNIGQYVDLNAKLSETNKNLWKLEDEIRALKDKHDTIGVEWSDYDTRRTLEIAFLIPEQNDRRARLVRQINNLVSGQETPKEKLY